MALMALIAPMALVALQTPMAPNKNHTLTAVSGLKVGHSTLKARPTGCTVILAEQGVKIHVQHLLQLVQVHDGNRLGCPRIGG